MGTVTTIPNFPTDLQRRSIISKLGIVVTVPIFFLVPAQAEQSRQFRAGAATSNITPPLGVSLNGLMQDRAAGHIHDELHARCLALDDGETRLALVVVDSCMVPRDIFDRAKKLIHEQTGLPADKVLMSATHTHSAPTVTPVFQSDPDPHYPHFLVVRIADGVRRAINNLAPARIGWGVGKVPDQVFNRRWRMKPGTVLPNPFGGGDQVKMNPPAASPDLLQPAGPTDPELPVISVQSAEGRNIALLANYSLHYVGGTGPGHVSADYFGMFADRIQQLVGADRLDPDFVGILSNGTSGDINNIDFRVQRERLPPYAQMRRVAHSVAAEAFRIYQSIQHRDWALLDARATEIELVVRLPNEENLKRARAIMAKAKGPAMQTQEEIYARETVLLSQYPENVRMTLQALRIGDLGITAIPCEVFVEIGLELKRRSPLQPAFTIELANGYNGYLPTEEQHRLGGYETWRARSSYLETSAAPKIIQKLLELLDGLKKD